MADGPERRDGERDGEHDADDGGLRISLPPMTLPDFFPEDFRPNFRPAERVRTTGASPKLVFVLAVLVDAANAALVLGSVGGALPALAATLLGLVLLGRRGALQCWEVLPAVFAPPLGAFPTLSVLALSRLR